MGVYVIKNDSAAVHKFVYLVSYFFILYSFCATYANFVNLLFIYFSAYKQ